MSTFIGKYVVKADAKGRVFIPSVYRKMLSEEDRERLIIRKDPERDCLIFYPQQIWTEMIIDLKSKLDEWNPDDQMLLMQFVSDAEWLDIDTQGRILLSKKVQNLIGIDNCELLFVGSVDRFTIWSKLKYEQSILKPADFVSRLKDRVMKKE